MKKLILLTVFLVFVFGKTYAQKELKENVPIVWSKCSESSKNFLDALAARMQSSGYTDSYNFLKNISDGSFGSGFVYADSVSGNCYVITNRHVVSLSEKVRLEFVHLDKPVELKNCQVLAIDETLDLALIQLPKEEGFQFDPDKMVKSQDKKEIKAINNSFTGTIGEGLPILSSRQEEGTEVYSAGFPGLAGKPSWQLGKGIISNSSVKSEMFSGTSDIGAIQHTAAIDPGSSGGPLLIKKEGKYQVIGVNTWGVVSRENAYFSISAEAINRFLGKYLDKSYDSEADLKRRAEEFIGELQKDYLQATPFISNEYINHVSSKNFFNLVAAAPDSVSEQMKNHFVGGFPIDAVRIGLSYYLHEQLGDKKVSVLRIESTDKKDLKKVVLLVDEKEVETYWVYGLGEWRLKENVELNLANVGPKKFDPWGDFKLGYEHASNSDNITANVAVLEYHRYRNPYFSTGFRAMFGKSNDVPESTTPTGSNVPEIIKAQQEDYSLSVFSGEWLVAGHYPITMGSFYLIPRVQAGVGVAFCGEDKGGLCYSYGGGLDFAYQYRTKKYLLLGLGYRKAQLGFDSDSWKLLGAFQVHLGIAF